MIDLFNFDWGKPKPPPARTVKPPPAPVPKPKPITAPPKPVAIWPALWAGWISILSKLTRKGKS